MLKMSTGVFPFSGFCTWQEIVGVAPELTNLELVSLTKWDVGGKGDIPGPEWKFQ